MSYRKSEAAREIAAERRAQDRERTMSRQRDRRVKGAVRSAFGGVL